MPLVGGAYEPRPRDEQMYQAAAAEAQTRRAASMQRGGKGRPQVLQIGEWEIETWYAAPYPEEYALLPRLYLCEWCLKYMKCPDTLRRHTARCECAGSPPGSEIYRRGAVQVWEVDGREAKIYCQNLCLLAKLFLDHKTLFYDVESFRFYVLTIRDAHGAHIAGYFSKEKSSALKYNLSCILTMPHMQKRGYGRLLIDVSFLLSRLEGTTGTPEKPLSDLGALAYEAYWRSAVLGFLNGRGDPRAPLSIEDISTVTGINPEDVMATLQRLDALREDGDGRHAIVLPLAAMAAQAAKASRNADMALDPGCLRWTPPAA